MNDASSPKNVGRSIEKRIFNHEKSDKKLYPKALNNTGNLQNLSIKNIENQGKNAYTGVQDTPTTVDTMSKDDKKFVSKLLIAEVHFCRFLYKLLGRIKESMSSGLFKDSPKASCLFKCFTQVIENKVTKLKEFEHENYLDIEVDKYE